MNINKSEKIEVEIVVRLPQNIRYSDTRLASCETRTDVKKELVRRWNRWMRRYRLVYPKCCETCTHVGQAQWHCHSPDSPQQHINVMPMDVCLDWVPNAGLLMYLDSRYGRAEREKLEIKGKYNSGVQDQPLNDDCAEKPPRPKNRRF